MKTIEEYLGKVSITCNGKFNSQKEYDRLCLVYDDYKASYLSKQAVPKGSSLTDETYWQPFSTLNEAIVLDYEEFQTEILKKIADLQTALNSARITVTTLSARDSLTLEQIAPGAEVYVLENKMTYILDAIDTQNHKSWHLENEGNVDAKKKDAPDEYPSTLPLYQLNKLDESTLTRFDIFPLSVLQAIFDTNGARLDNILAQFNYLFLDYKGTAADTRVQVPQRWRRKSLVICYRDYNNNVHIEMYNDIYTDDANFKMDSRWVGLADYLVTTIDTIFGNLDQHQQVKNALTTVVRNYLDCWLTNNIADYINTWTDDHFKTYFDAWILANAKTYFDNWLEQNFSNYFTVWADDNLQDYVDAWLEANGKNILTDWLVMNATLILTNWLNSNASSILNQYLDQHANDMVTEWLGTHANDLISTWLADNAELVIQAYLTENAEGVITQWLCDNYTTYFDTWFANNAETIIGNWLLNNADQYIKNYMTENAKGVIVEWLQDNMHYVLNDWMKGHIRDLLNTWLTNNSPAIIKEWLDEHGADYFQKWVEKHGEEFITKWLTENSQTYFDKWLGENGVGIINAWIQNNAALQFECWLNNHAGKLVSCWMYNFGRDYIKTWLENNSTETINNWLEDRGDTIIENWVAEHANEILDNWIRDNGVSIINNWLTTNGDQILTDWLDTNASNLVNKYLQDNANIINNAVNQWIESNGSTLINNWLTTTAAQTISQWLTDNGSTIISEFVNQYLEEHDFDIANYVDEEDLTTVANKSGKNLIRFADRNGSLGGKKYKILRPNFVEQDSGSINVLTQEMINESNCIYEIRYDFNLNGATINIPEGCTLKFEGGSLSNGRLVGEIENTEVNIVNFGATKDSDIAPILDMLLNLSKSADENSRPSQSKFTILIPSGIWKCSALEIVNRSGFSIKGISQSFQQYDISRRGTVIVPYSSNQTYIWKLGNNVANTGQCLNWDITNITFSDYDSIAVLTEGALYLYYASFGFLNNIAIKDLTGIAINFVNTWEIDSNNLNIRDSGGYYPKILFSKVTISEISSNHTQLHFNFIQFENCDGRFIETENGCYLSHSIIDSIIVEWYPKNKNATISSYEEYTNAEEYSLIRLSADVNLIIGDITIDRGHKFFEKDGIIYKLNTIFDTNDDNTMYSPCQLSVGNIHIEGDSDNSGGINGTIFDSTHLPYIIPFKNFQNSSINCNGILIHGGNSSYPKCDIKFKLKNTAVFNINSIINRCNDINNKLHIFNIESNPVIYANNEQRVGYNNNGCINYEENNPYNWGLYVNLNNTLLIPFNQNKSLIITFKGDKGTNYSVYLGTWNGGDYFSKSSNVEANGEYQSLNITMPKKWDNPYIPLNIIGSSLARTIKIYKVEYTIIYGEPSLFKDRPGREGDVAICRGRAVTYNLDRQAWIDSSFTDISVGDRGGLDSRPEGSKVVNGFVYWNVDHGDYDIWNGYRWISASGWRFPADTLNVYNVIPLNSPIGYPIFYTGDNIPYWSIGNNNFVDGVGNNKNALKIGNTNNRPSSDLIKIGFQYIDTTLNKIIWWNGTEWIDYNGNPADVKTSGSTTDRPTGVQVGFQYFDTDINSPVYWSGTEWVQPTTGNNRS